MNKFLFAFLLLTIVAPSSSLLSLDPIEEKLLLFNTFSIVRVAGVLADESVYTDGVLRFSNPQSSFPRIIKSYLGLSNNGAITIQPFDISGTGTLSVHLFQLEELASLESIDIWQSDEYLKDFPLESDLVNFEKIPDEEDILEPAQTNFAHLFPFNAENYEAKCSLRVTHQGIIRSIFADGINLGFAGGETNSFVETTFDHTILIGSESYVSLTIFGYSLKIQDIEFISCIDVNSEDSVNPEIQLFYPKNYILKQDLGLSNAPTIACQDGSEVCLTESLNLKCDLPKVLSVEGECLEICPENQYLQHDGTCRNELNSAILPQNSNIAAQVLDIEAYLDFAERSSEVLVFLFPEKPSNQQTPSLIDFNSDGDTPSLARGHIATAMTDEDGLISTSIPNVSPIENTIYIGFASIIDEELLVTNINADTEKPVGYYYSTIGTLIEFEDQNQLHHITTILECTLECTIKIYANNHVTVLQDFTTPILDLQFGDYSWSYTLHKTIEAGSSHVLQFYGDMTEFKLTVSSADYEAYTHSSLGGLMEYNYEDELYTCSIGAIGCEQCESDTCYSCYVGRKLNEDDECVLSCSAELKVLLAPEQRCVSSCPDGTSLSLGVCLPDCEDIESPANYIEGLGCVSQCPLNCDVCNESLECQQCKDNFSLVALDQCVCELPKILVGDECVCPPGFELVGGNCDCNFPREVDGDECLCGFPYFESGDDGCVEAVLNFVIDETENIDFCEEFSLEIETNSPFELLSYVWDVNSEASSDIQDLIMNIDSDSLAIPNGKLEPNTTYEFEVRRINILSGEITKQIAITTAPEFVISIDGGFEQNVIAEQETQITAGLNFASCVDIPTEITAYWEEVGSSDRRVLSAEARNLQIGGNQFQLSIPQCSLLPGHSYQYRFVVEVGGQTFKSEPITIETEEIGYEVVILNGNQSYQVEDTVTLEAKMVSNDLCQSAAEIDASLEYVWVSDQFSPAANTDPSDLFETTSASNTLTIPSSYFLQFEDEESFIINIKVVVWGDGSNVYEAFTDLYMQQAETIPFNISCNKGLCTRFAQSQDYVFKASNYDTSEDEGILGFLDLDLYQFSWNVEVQTFKGNEFVSFTSIFGLWFQFTNQLKIPKQSLDLSPYDHIRISLNISNSTHFGSKQISIPINQAPKAGKISLNVINYDDEESNSRKLYSPFYNISASEWSDPNTPLSYKFDYKLNGNIAIYKPITKVQKSNFVVSQLPSANSEITIRVTVSDIYGASSKTEKEFTLSTSIGIEQSAATGFLHLMQSKIEEVKWYDPSQALQDLSLIASEFSSTLENYAQENDVLGDSCENKCSGNGVCSNGQCICKIGWTLPDCSMSLIDYQQILSQNFDLLEGIQEMAASIDELDSSQISDILSDLEEISSSEIFNSNKTLGKIMEILTNTINFANTTLTDLQSLQLMQILDNILQSISLTDCGVQNEFTKSLQDKASLFLDTVREYVLDTILPTEDPVTLIGESFDLYVHRVTPCMLQNYTITLSPNTPNITLRIKDNGTELNCSKLLKLEVYAFSSELFDCEEERSSFQLSQRQARPRMLQDATADASEPLTKTDIMIRITDEEGNEIKDVAVDFEGLEPEQCHETCTIDDNSKCACESLDFFDVEGQFSRIFSNAKFNALENISLLGNPDFYTSPAFWLIIGTCAWFIISILLIQRCFKEQYCKYQSYLGKSTEKKRSAFWVLVLISHPIFSVYVFHDKMAVKSARLCLVFAEVLLLMAYNAIFQTFAYEENETYVFNVYLIILEMITVNPIMMFITYLIKSDPDVQFKTKNLCERIKIVMGYFFSISFTIVAMLFLLTIAAEYSFEQRKTWTINFVILIAEDFVAIPLVMISIKVIFFYLIIRSKITNKKAIKKIKKFIQEEALNVLRTHVDRKERSKTMRNSKGQTSSNNNDSEGSDSSNNSRNSKSNAKNENKSNSPVADTNAQSPTIPQEGVQINVPKSIPSLQFSEQDDNIKLRKGTTPPSSLKEISIQPMDISDTVEAIDPNMGDTERQKGTSSNKVSSDESQPNTARDLIKRRAHNPSLPPILEVKGRESSNSVYNQRSNRSSIDKRSKLGLENNNSIDEVNDQTVAQESEPHETPRRTTQVILQLEGDESYEEEAPK